MLLEPTLARLRELRLAGMAEALEEQKAAPDLRGLSFEDRLGLLVDRRIIVRVEIVHDSPRIAAHPHHNHRSGPFTTAPSHQPEALEKGLKWTPPRLIRWTEKTEPHTGTVAHQIIEAKAHPEQAPRSSRPRRPKITRLWTGGFDSYTSCT